MTFAVGTLPFHKEKRDTDLLQAALAGPTGTVGDPRAQNALSHSYMTLGLEADGLDGNDYEGRVP